MPQNLNRRTVEVMLAPLLSIATAVTVYVPAGTFVHVSAYGDVVSVAMSVVPAKKLTCAIVPSGS